MGSFMRDPETGKMMLKTRRRAGGGCHGAKNLQWKPEGDGLETLVCKVCGKTHGERLRCFRCEGFKEEVPCRVCAAAPGVRTAEQRQRLAEKRSSVGLPRRVEEDVPLACKGTGGLCCRHAADAGAMTEKQVDLARHALGLDGRRKVSYRNHFVTGPGPGNDDHPQWIAMVAAGYATRRKGNEITGGDDLFRMTLSGARAVLRGKEKLDPEDFPEMEGGAS